MVEGAFNLEDLSENFVVEGVKSGDLGRSVKPVTHNHKGELP